MPRKKPFSAKQKKLQLQEKRVKKAGKLDYDLDEVSGSLPTVVRHGGVAEGRAAGEQAPPAARAADGKFWEIRKINHQPRDETDSGYRPNRYRLHFIQESKQDVEQRKKIARLPLQPLPLTSLEAKLDDFYTPALSLGMPRRPSWSREMTKEQLQASEEHVFQEFLEHIKEKCSSEEISYFELNIETWRQLWRVLEMSDVVLLVLDIRFVPLHFPPALFEYIVKETKKKLVLILNKCDLVTQTTVDEWSAYLKETFPGVHVVPFASFHSALTGNPASKKRQRVRLGVANGLETLLHEWRAMKLPHLDEWESKVESLMHNEEERLRRRRERGASDTEEEDEEEEEEEEEEDEEEVGEEASRRGRDRKPKNQAAAQEADVGAGVGDEAEEDGESVAEGKKYVTIGLVGQPNVGKSTVLNSLIGKKVVSTSSTPGHTKYFQTYFMAPHIRLCDCPGLIFPSLVSKHMQVVAGLYPISQVREPYTAIKYVAERLDLVALLKLTHDDYEEPNTPWSAWGVCDGWARARGYLTAKAGRPDTYRAANDLLRHITDGRIVLSLKPPGFFTRHPDEALAHIAHNQKNLALAKQAAEKEDPREVARPGKAAFRERFAVHRVPQGAPSALGESDESEDVSGEDVSEDGSEIEGEVSEQEPEQEQEQVKPAPKPEKKKAANAFAALLLE